MCRTFGLSTATYGWVGRRPTKDEMQRLTNTVCKTGRGLRMASSKLRNVIEGIVNLEASIGCRQMGLLRTMCGGPQPVAHSQERVGSG
jgi:hypothetical protein